MLYAAVIVKMSIYYVYAAIYSVISSLHVCCPGVHGSPWVSVPFVFSTFFARVVGLIAINTNSY